MVLVHPYLIKLASPAPPSVIPAKFSSPASGRGTREGMKIAFSKEAGIQGSKESGPRLEFTPVKTGAGVTVWNTG